MLVAICVVKEGTVPIEAGTPQSVDESRDRD